MSELDQRQTRVSDSAGEESTKSAGNKLSETALEGMKCCAPFPADTKNNGLPSLTLEAAKAEATKTFKSVDVPDHPVLDSPDWHKHSHKKGEPGEFLPKLAKRTAPDPVVADVLSKISESTIKSQIEQLSGATDTVINGKKVKIETRSTYGGYEQGLQFFKEKFEKDGYTVTLDPYTRRGQTYYNLRAIKAGTTRPDEAVMYGAHIDSTAGWPWAKEAKAPGADDDGSGAVAIAEIAHAMKDVPTDRTVVFSLFSGEEQGLWGSRAMAEQYKAAQEGLDKQAGKPTKIVAMYQMDMIGYAVDSKTVESHDSTDDPKQHALTDLLASKQQQYNIDLKVYGAHNDELGNRSDHYSFNETGVPAVLLTEPYDTANGENPTYHSTRDTAEKVNIPFVANVARLAAAAGLELAGVVKNPMKSTKIPDNVIDMMPLRTRISNF